jgi:hypothetical protein
MSISNTTETAVLKLIYQAIAYQLCRQCKGTPQTLVDNVPHTGDPLDAGSQRLQTPATSHTGCGLAQHDGWTESWAPLHRPIDFAVDRRRWHNHPLVDRQDRRRCYGHPMVGTVTQHHRRSGVPRLTTASIITLD